MYFHNDLDTAGAGPEYPLAKADSTCWLYWGDTVSVYQFNSECGDRYKRALKTFRKRSRRFRYGL